MAREISISFALNAALGAGFKAAFQSASQSARNVATAIREMEKSPVGHLGAAMAQQREKIKGLAGSLKEAKATLATLQGQAQASGGATRLLARQIEQAQASVNNLSGALARQRGLLLNTAAQAATSGRSIRQLGQDYNNLTQQIERARRVQSAMAANRAQGDALRNQRADLNSRLAGAAGAAATVAIPAKLSIDFEQSVANVGAVMAESTEEDLQRLTKTARDLGRDTMFSASQAAEGMKYLAMAGFDANDTIAAMPGMLDLAAAGNTDLATTADIASDILTAFGMKASEMGDVGDTLAKTFTTSNTDLSMLGETMKYVGPVAHTLGMSLQDTSAMAGALANAGIKASQGGTVMRAALLRLAAPPKMAKEALGELAGVAGPELDELYDQIGDTGNAQDALKELGMTTRDEAGNLRPMVDILEELNMRTANMGTAEKAAVFKNVFGTEASAGMMALAEQASVTVDKYGNKIVDSTGNATNALRKQMETVNNFQGTCGKISEKMNATTGGALRRLKSAWENAGISVGNLFLPAIQTAATALSVVANVISGVTERFPRLSKGIALTVGAVLAFTAASVGLGLVINVVRSSLNSVRGGLLRMAASQVVATASTTALAGAQTAGGLAARFFAGGLRSILLASGVGALLVGLGYGISLLIDNWDTVVAAMSSAWTAVTETWTRLGVFFSTLGENLAAIFAPIWGNICSMAATARDTVVGIWQGAIALFGAVIDGIVSVFSWARDGIVSLFSSASDNAVGMWQGVTGFFTSVGEAIVGVFSWAADGIGAVWQGITGFFTSVGNSITGVFTWTANSISAAWQGVADFFGGVAAFIESVFPGAWETVSAWAAWCKDTVMSIWNGVTEFFGGIVESIRGVFAGFFGWLADKFAWVTSTVNAIKGFVGKITGTVSDLAGKVVDAVSGSASRVAGAASEMAGEIGGAVKGAYHAATAEGEAGDKKVAAARVQAVKEKSAARAAQEAKEKPVARGAEGARSTPAQFKPVSKKSVDAQNPEPPKKSNGKKSGGGSRKSSGSRAGAGGGSGGGGGRSASESGAVAPAANGASGAPVTVVTLDSGNEIKTQFIPAKPLGAQRPYGFGVPLAGAASPAANANRAQEKSDRGFMASAAKAFQSTTRVIPAGIGDFISQGLQAGIGMAKSIFGVAEKTGAPQVAEAGQTAKTIIASPTAKTPVIQVAQTAQALGKNGASALQTSGQPALPRTPAMIAKKQGQKSGNAQAGQQRSRWEQSDLTDAASSLRGQSISIDLTQNFDLITQDAAAARKVLEAIRPDMEALVRKALAKIQSDRTRTAYAQ